MRKQPNEKMIGIFMVAGLAAFIFVIGMFLKEKFMSDSGDYVVMYFDESIKGLNVGSSVVFKGVEVGKVVKIELLANAKTLDFSIPVFVKMDKSQGITTNGTGYGKQEMLDELIARGLRARLTSQSYLTGQLMIELEMLPDTKISMKAPSTEKNIYEIPTVLSPIGEISKGIQDIPVRQSVEKFNEVLDNLNQQLPVILPKINKVVGNIDKIVGENKAASAETIDNLNKTIINVGEAAKSVKNLMDYLEQHPESMIKGKEDN